MFAPPLPGKSVRDSARPGGKETAMMPIRRRPSSLWSSLDTDDGHAQPVPLPTGEHSTGYNPRRPSEPPTASARNEWPTLINRRTC